MGKKWEDKAKKDLEGIFCAKDISDLLWINEENRIIEKEVVIIEIKERGAIIM